MLTVNTNTTSLITQLNLSKSNNFVKTSIERMSTGFKINRASDDAANMSISKNMECQISGTNVALDNAQQAVNLLQTADGALDNMQANLLRVRDLTVQAMNGTYSSEEKAMIQGEIDNLLAETYKQRNSTMFNQIRIFGDVEELPLATTVPLDGGNASVESVNLNNAVSQTGGTHPVTPLTEEEAIAQGYTCIHNETEFANMLDEMGAIDGRYCLMGDIDFTKISNWGAAEVFGEINGNGYSINNLTINSTTNSDMHGLFSGNYGTIKNLNLNNVSIDKDDYNMCGLVSSNYNGSTIEKCSVSGSIKGGENTGGLVGYNYEGTITNCYSSATVTGIAYTGGLVGYSENGIITNCSTSGTITGTSYTGGLVGYSYAGTITDCSSSGNVTGTNSTGGLVGNNYYGGTITACSSSGTVTGNNQTGGLVGDNYEGTITSSSSSATITANDKTGGLVGNSENGTITSCSSSATVTGTSQTGGLTGRCYRGIITSCSSSGAVTGTSQTGGLVGLSTGVTVNKSYSTGDVSGNDRVGGLIGTSGLNSNISNSYSLGDVMGNDNIGGFIGYNVGNISTSYSAGTIEENGTNVGGFVGSNGYQSNTGNINNSYTTSELDFYGVNNAGEITGCHGRTEQTGVTAHDEGWFEDGSNLSFLGSAYDTSTIPPDIIGNERPIPPVPPPPPTPTSTEIVFQIGANSGVDNTITIDTGFSLNGLTADVSSLTAGEKTLNDIDGALERMSSFRSTIGAMQNRLESISQSLATRKNNMESSHSTIMDTDFALETSKLVQNQILQNVAASLLAQANTNPNIALTLLK